MRTVYGYLSWLIAVVLFVGMMLEGTAWGTGVMDWIGAFAASIGTLWNADPAFGYRDTDYVQTYVESWAETKI